MIKLLFPPKCVLCRKILLPGQKDLCGDCRLDAPVFRKEKIKLSFIAGWAAVWYYKDNVRESLLRYKFGHHRSYAPSYARILAETLRQKGFDQVDLLVWVPISPLRQLRRGFDQVKVLAECLSRELDIPLVCALKKVRNTPPQSTLKFAAQRRANVMGAFVVKNEAAIQGKRVLLVDDIITTGATVSECAKMLIMSGASEVFCGAVAAAAHDQKQSN